MTSATTVLGLESSCDDTAAAIVRQTGTGKAEVLVSIVLDQSGLHDVHGGVVPEIAARAHAGKLDVAVEMAFEQTGLAIADIDLVAVTAGPGLIGGLLSGVMCAKGIAAGAGIPLIGVNHLAGHALTPRMTDDAEYPYLVLLASGGHCQFITVRGPDRFQRLGGTIDDAPGEAFDKVARMLGLGYPGGPAVEKAAARGDPNRFSLPRPLIDREDMNLSFSGLKTAVLRTREKIGNEMDDADIADICSCFQLAVAECLASKTARACRHFMAHQADSTADRKPMLAVAGGVAANALVREMLSRVADDAGFTFVAPPLKYCTDNAAMIAWAGLEMHEMGHRDGFDLEARPRWPLDPDAPPMLGSGKRMHKA